MARRRGKAQPPAIDQEFDLFGFTEPAPAQDLSDIDIFGEEDDDDVASSLAGSDSDSDLIDDDLVVDIDEDDDLAADAFGVSELNIAELARRAEVGRLESAPRRVNLFDMSAVADAASSAQSAAAITDESLDVKKMSKEERKAYIKALGDELSLYPHLLAIKPREKYVFRSDHVEVDGSGSVMCVLAFFHADEANDEFLSFWGVERLPDNMPEGVRAILIESVERKSDKWIVDAEKKSERLTKLDEREQSTGGGTMRTKRKTAKGADDLFTTIGELQDGAAYLSVHMRLALYAPNLAKLDLAIERLSRQYIDRIPSVTTAPYHGEQRQELSSLLVGNDKRRGLGFHFTSTEYAGAYSLVTNGLRDSAGEYVGRMSGDYNTSAILLEVDRWDHHMVCADETINEKLGRTRASDMWASKISQAALLNNHRVVHLVLNGADLYRLGPPMDSITTRLDMSRGEINMFELFGDRKDQLAVYDVHQSKLVLMVEQLLDDENVRDIGVIRSELREALTSFYTDHRMWAQGAEKHPDRLRLVGIKHSQVPTLRLFQPHIETLYDSLIHQEANDELRLRAVKAIQGVVNRMLNSNSQLFNQPTSDSLDDVRGSRRVIYDFSDLVNRGEGLAMAQLVNALGFATNSLEQGDVVIIHGADEIRSPSVQSFLHKRFERLMDKVGARIAFFYDKPDTMLDHREFNRFERADYTVMGPMAKETIANYEALMRTAIPGELKGLLAMRGYALSYLRRGQVNVVFSTELSLGLDHLRDPDVALAGEEVAAQVAQVRRDSILAERSALAELERKQAEEVARRKEALSSSGAPSDSGK